MNISADMQRERAQTQQGCCDNLGFAPALRECSAAGVIVVDGHRQIITFNPVAERLTQRPSGTMVGQPLEALPSPLREILGEALTRDASVSTEVSLPGDPPVTFNVTTTRMAGDPPGLVAVCHDMSLAYTLDQKMRQLDRLASIGTLSASMAHEIKNALVAIKTFIELLLRQNKDSELAGIVGREMKRIDSIVSQMLRFAGPAKPTFALVRVHDVLGHALKLVQHQVEGRKVKLHQCLSADTDVVRGDGYQIEQAFLNILFNALEATGAQGEVTVTSEIISRPLPASQPPVDVPHLRVTIRDNGTGIAPQDVDRLFEPFYTTKPRGTGLGLSITRRIIEEHRGSIQVESELNKGASFGIVLPVATTAPASAEHPTVRP